MRFPEEFRDRTKRYAASIVRFYATAPKSREIEVLAHQLLKSGTSVAARVREASRARSTAEFNSKVNGALQEADESQLWLELLNQECGIRGEEIEWLLGETSELLAIFVTIAHKTSHRDT